MSISQSLSERIRSALGKIKNIRLIVFLGIAGMIIILLSELIPPAVKKTKNTQTAQSFSQNDYCGRLEKEIQLLLGKINGVGRVNVMLTVEGTEETVYAQQNKSSKSENGESSSQQDENSYIFIQESGDKEALVEKVINPAITGVVVVCDGGDNAKVRESIYNAVSVSLNVPANKIFVAELEKANKKQS
ncbi:MAG: hypothetical protein Q4F95_13580 [Oscillospiraceae bacterium]|nr:hypothetical protein [Oscillospiraceae bacterium]